MGGGGKVSSAGGSLKVGDLRSDGYRFWCYRKKPDGSFYEIYRSPESFERCRQLRNKGSERWRKQYRLKYGRPYRRLSKPSRIS